MDIREQPLRGVYAIEGFRRVDGRGTLCKPFSRPTTGPLEAFSCAEFFYSWSKRNVIRGMHMQLGPAMLEKLVVCIGGTVLDVLVDLRAGADFGKVVSLELSEERGEAVFVPRGVAHGFLSLSDMSVIGYLTSGLHVPDLDGGVHWRSIDFDWPVQNPIISRRDAGLPPITEIGPIGFKEQS